MKGEKEARKGQGEGGDQSRYKWLGSGLGGQTEAIGQLLKKIE